MRTFIDQEIYEPEKRIPNPNEKDLRGFIGSATLSSTMSSGTGKVDILDIVLPEIEGKLFYSNNAARPIFILVVGRFLSTCKLNPSPLAIRNAEGFQPL